MGGSCLTATLGLALFAACGTANKGTGATTDGGAGDAGTDADAANADVTNDVTTDADAANDSGMTDALPDSPLDAGDVGPCTGVLCGSQCLQASDCRLCAGAPLLCGSTRACVSVCTDCADTQDAAMPIECFACDSNHQNPIGTCQYADAGAYCLSGDYLGQYQGGQGYQCGCSEAGACPGATQVCVPLGNVGAAFCLTCGEPTVGQIQGAPCKDGGTCQESLALCQ